MSSAYVVLSVLTILFGGLSAQWAYTSKATTHDGRPCLTDCTNNNCIVDWEGSRAACSEDKPRYRTAQVIDKAHEYCLSNCGFFGYDYEWCIISNDKKWDYCNSGDEHVSVHKRPCKGQCAKYGESYYWCNLDGGLWEICAPPREKHQQ